MVESFIDIPDDYCCPITGDLMEDPVVAPDGQSYERESITTWFKRNKTSPLTGVTLKNTFLIDNHRLKAIITNFKEKMPEIQREGQIKRDLLEAIKSREAFVEDRLKKEEEKYSSIAKQYNIEKEKNVSIENELAACKEENMLLRKQLNEYKAANKAKDEEIKTLKEELAKDKNTLEESKTKFESQKVVKSPRSSTLRNISNAIKCIYDSSPLKRESKDQENDQVSIWICSCGFGNEIDWEICSSCYLKKPGIDGWVCQNCKYKNDDCKKICDICGEKF